jgi:hypothetical protein
MYPFELVQAVAATWCLGEIERLKRELSVERLAEARGVKLRWHGAYLIGPCPFHDDQG